MLPTYSPHGCPGDNFYCYNDKSVKIIIDPGHDYFRELLPKDRENFDILLLVHGMEPKENNDITNSVIQYHSYFNKVLSSYPEVINSCNNSELFLYASCWILTRQDKTRAHHRTQYYNIFSTEKKFKLSFVMSQKNWLPGHNLRFRVKDDILKNRSYEVFFPHSIPMDDKYMLFEESMFHIAIENTKNINYISEKIIDCFMSYTLPIYWGCPNIGDFFNTDGILFFNNEHELTSILDSLTPDEYYRRLPAIIENYNIANERYAFHADRINKVIDDLTKK